jgi:peroxiredoxin Q/BCP
MLMISAYGCAQTQKNKDNMKIKTGSEIPPFSLPDQDGKMFDVTKIIGKKNLVIYFYPKDDSPGCTKEACYFRDQYEIFLQANAMIIGISGQSVESHKKFADKYNLKYTLLSDKGNKVRKIFGVPANFLGTLPGRVTYICDKTGHVVYVFNSQTQPTRHVDEALRILKNMQQ